MPTPFGHAVAGLATAWFAESTGGTTPGNANKNTSWTSPLAVACAAVAMLPDVDLLLGSHRTYTHSFTAVAGAGFITWLALRRRTPSASAPSDATANKLAVRIALIIAAAYGSHLLLDWLGRDTSNPPGLTVFWPFTSRFYISGVDLFKEVSRRYWKPDEFIAGNFRALGWELVILGPVAAFAGFLKSRRRHEGSRRHEGYEDQEETKNTTNTKTNH